ncbi:MAG: hypothetical protein K5874_00280 [Bacteroidaceae bacterium]|nr:hypothetical protein [Bacteroidaceae bacterium]
MIKEKLILNTLTFEYPKEPVKFYFSDKDDAERKSTQLKSPVLVPKEVKQTQKYTDLFAGCGGIVLYTSFDLPTEGFDAIDIDFNAVENEYLVKRYYNRRLEKYFRYYDDVVVTKSGITDDIQVWLLRGGEKSHVNYNGKQYELMAMDRFTIRVKYDRFNNWPYLLVANDRPALLLNVPLKQLFNDFLDEPFTSQTGITPSMINFVMTREVKKGSSGEEYVVHKINKYEYLQSHNMYCPLETTRPIMGGELKRFLGMDKHEETRSFESKYIRYKEKIEAFRKRFLNTEDIEKIFHNLAYDFTEAKQIQVGQTNSSKRMLIFGKDENGNDVRNVRQQSGVNFGPHIKCPHTNVQMIFIFPKSSIEEARNLIKYMRKGGYKGQSKALSNYIGSNVAYADPSFHIQFEDEANPVPEIEKALQADCYRNKDNRIKYVGIYISPIHKYASAHESKECYYKIKEILLKYNIPTQCIDRDKMNDMIDKDNRTEKYNFAYTLQNMGVAICAKLGGSPWLLDETDRKELIIGIGAFRCGNQQYIGAAFSFDNTGIFNDYSYFEKSELDELIGAIKLAIIRYSSVNNQPERIIIHYYKKISRKREFKKVEDMLHSLSLDVPVYIVTINKTESEDIVLFDEESTYSSYNYKTRQSESVKSLMPYSGKWVNLGPSKEGHRYLLCNNTRYEGEKFSAMDGFPFPVKLTIACPNRNDEIETPVIQQLIDQVYQFSRIYWKSVKQQGLPVTIKYPEMIAEIMPHFNDKTVYTESNCLWFL